MASGDCNRQQSEVDVEDSGPKFDPPLFKQRYAKVRDILQDENISKVADFGCAEGKFLWYLKQSSTIGDVAAIDVHESILYKTSQMASPLMWDYLFKREKPLRIRVFKGSIAERDSRMMVYEAITGIELIEHLESQVLHAFPEVVFEFLKPRLVILTTPNAEFNVLFRLTKKFRHWDHKFEWTRQEFQNWCEAVTTRYPCYSVSYDGVGEPPPESNHVGHCSQIAVFKMNNWTPHCLDNSHDEKHMIYKLIDEHHHPSKDET